MYARLRAGGRKRIGIPKIGESEKIRFAGIVFFRSWRSIPNHRIAITAIRYAVCSVVQGILAHPCAIEPVCGTEIPGTAGTTFVHSSPLAEDFINAGDE